jgi:hypothetical protein
VGGVYSRHAFSKLKKGHQLLVKKVDIHRLLLKRVPKSVCQTSLDMPLIK